MLLSTAFLAERVYIRTTVAVVVGMEADPRWLKISGFAATSDRVERSGSPLISSNSIVGAVFVDCSGVAES